MYQQIVRHKLRQAFAALNQGRADAVVREMAHSAEHHFVGQHALGGTRRSTAAIAGWYARLLRLFPDIRFDIDRIDVAGPPWRTLAVVRWQETNTATDGVRTANQGVNVITIAWGKVRSVRIYTDTAVLMQTLNRLAAGGVQEATAQPIEG